MRYRSVVHQGCSHHTWRSVLHFSSVHHRLLSHFTVNRFLPLELQVLSMKLGYNIQVIYAEIMMALFDEKQRSFIL